jgi:hypothetical protein
MSVPVVPVVPVDENKDRDFDQVVKGDVKIKKLSDLEYQITFRNIGDFLVYQVFNKDNLNQQNDSRNVVTIVAEDWVTHFTRTNNELRGTNKPLFTPTTIMETKDGEHYAFVIKEAYIDCRERVVFKVSTNEINLVNNTSKMIKLPCGKHRNMRFDIDADDNGWGVVYHRSNCGGDSYRWYGFGGRTDASACRNWIEAGGHDPSWSQYYGPMIHSADYNWREDEVIRAMLDQHWVAVII